MKRDIVWNLFNFYLARYH